MKESVMVESYFPVIMKKDSTQPLYITSIGKTAEQNFTERKKGMNSFQLLYTACGEGFAEIDDKKYRLEKGSILFTSPGLPNRYYPTVPVWTTYWITFSGRSAKSMFHQKSALLNADGAFDFIGEYKKIFAQTSAPFWQKKTGILLYEFILNCLELMPQSIENNSLKKKLAPAIDYINKNYCSDIEIKFLSGLCGISFEHFCRSFKACTGSRPTEYITACRIQKAKSYLQSGASVSDAARLTGFATTAYFGKQFKKYENITPSEFKKL